MKPRRSTMQSPLPALLIDCVAPVFPVSTRALLAGGVMGVGGGGREGTRRPDEDTWSPLVLTSQVRGRAADASR